MGLGTLARYLKSITLASSWNKNICTVWLSLGEKYHLKLHFFFGLHWLEMEKGSGIKEY